MGCDDVIRVITSAVAAGDKMLSCAAQIRKPVSRWLIPRGEILGICFPHGKATVVAAESLVSGGASSVLDYSSHADLHEEDVEVPHDVTPGAGTPKAGGPCQTRLRY